MADLSRDLFQQLAKYAMGPIPYQGTKSSDYQVALQIMKNSNVNFSGVWSPANSGQITEKKKDHSGPGVFGRIVDVLSRPLYASANAFKASGGLSSGVGMLYNLFTGNIDNTPDRVLDAIPAGWRGFTGKDKTTYSQLIRENEDLPAWTREGVSGFATGLTANIFGDPLTYIPIGGPLKAGFRAGYKIAGKEAPYAVLPTATKRAIKAARKGTPRATAGPIQLPPAVAAANQTPSAFKAGSLPVNPFRMLIPVAKPTVKQTAKQAAKTPKTSPVANAAAAAGRDEVGEILQDARSLLPLIPSSRPRDDFLRRYISAEMKRVPLSAPAREALEKIVQSTDIIQAMRDAPVVNTALAQGAHDAAAAQSILSAQQAAVHSQTINNEARTVLKAAEVSPAAQKTYSELMKNITYKARGLPQNAIDRNASKIALAITPQTQKAFRSNKGRFLPKGTLLPTVAKAGITGAQRATSGAVKRSAIPKISGVFGPVNTALSHAIQTAAHIPVTKLKPGETIAEAPVTRAMTARIATWVGQKDLRPLVLDHMTSAVARAATQTQAMERAFKGFSEAEALEAWEIARNAKPHQLASSATVSKLADILTGQMENFFRSRAVPESLAKGNSAAMRSGMLINDLNKALKRYDIPFKFTNGKAINPITNALTDYGKGTNWLISWETHAPKSLPDLKRFIFSLQSAAYQVMAHYAFVDDVAARLGSRSKTAIKNVKVADPRLADYYFDKEVADQLSTALSKLGEYYSPKSLATRFMRQAISKWKTGVTIYNPRHHVANIIGDTFLMWMAGINDPRVFNKAAKVMFANKGLYTDLATVEHLTGANALKDALAKPGTVVAKNKSGLTLTAQQAYIAAFNFGLLQKAGVVEDIAKEGIPLPGRLAKPFGGKVHGAFAGLSESREHYVKLAHFLGAFEKSSGRNTREVLEDVAHEVRKWHPDGLDLTKEEQAIRALAIPFYSWLRKSTPLVIEGALMRPQKAFTAYAKVNYSLQQALGIPNVSLSDPYPSDQIFPDWLRDDNVPVLGKTGQSGIAGFLGGLGRQGVDDQGKPLNAYTMLGPTNPVQDFFANFAGFRNAGETKDATLSNFSPFFKIPLELQQGRELYTGIPTKGRIPDYLTNQIPMVNQIVKITNVGPFGKTGRAEDYGIGNKEAFLNWVTGANITGTGPYIKSAEFEMIPEQRKENDRIRAFSAQIGYPLKEKGRIPQWIRDLYNQRVNAENGDN